MFFQRLRRAPNPRPNRSSTLPLELLEGSGIMIGATAVTLASGVVAPALVPAVVALLVASVADSRWRVVPLGASTARTSVLYNVRRSR